MSLAEVKGRIDSSRKQILLQRMLHSYVEIGKFPQLNQINEGPARRMQSFDFVRGFDIFLNYSNASERDLTTRSPGQRTYISCLDFDSKGVYLVSVSSTGTLAVYDYESLYCHSQDSNNGMVMPVVQLLLHQKLQAVCWNPNNPDEVACVSSWGSKVYCYDISRVSNNPSEVLKVNSMWEKKFGSTGLFDVSFCKFNANRVLACGRDGDIHVWDKRTSLTSQSIFSWRQGGYFNSLELARDEQVVYVGSSLGQIHAWDFRGGRSAAAFVTPSEVYNPPFATWKVATLLGRIPSLRAQTEIVMSGIQSINLNPCCDQQLAFHLNNGWSGVVDLSTFQVTHIHCPPPPWLYVERDEGMPTDTSMLQKRPTWLLSNSVYVCGSSSSSKISFLNFKLGPDSPHHVEENVKREPISNVEMSVSEPIVACAAHPMNDDIIAGTERASILLIGHKSKSVEEDGIQA